MLPWLIMFYQVGTTNRGQGAKTILHGFKFAVAGLWPSAADRCLGGYRYRKQATEDGGSYTMDHSAGVYVFDREGIIRAFLRHDQTPAELAHDITHFY